MKLNKKFATNFWDGIYMESDGDDEDNMSNCWLFGNLVLVQTENVKKSRYCYLKKDLSCGRISEAEHDMFVDYFGADYTDTYGRKFKPDANVSDTYWLRAGKHTKLKDLNNIKIK